MLSSAAIILASYENYQDTTVLLYCYCLYMVYIIIVCAAKLKSVEINKLLMHVRVDLGYLI